MDILATIVTYMSELSKTVAMIGNPVSDKGRGAKYGEQVFDLLSQAGLRYGFSIMDLTGDSFDDSLAKAHEYAHLYDALVVVGGDGMIALGANAVGGSRTPLGIVAVGSGNDFARGMKLPVNRLKTSVDGIVGALVRNTYIDVDMGRATSPTGVEPVVDRYFAGMLSCGLDAKINDRANHSRVGSGSMRYLSAVLNEVARLKPFGYHVKATLANGEIFEEDIVSPLLTVANSQHVGGGIELSPYSQFNDGYLDLIWVNRMPKLHEVAPVLPNLYNGKILSSKLFEWRRIRDIDISYYEGGQQPPVLMADGEYLGSVPVHVQAMDRMLRVLVPPAVTNWKSHRDEEQTRLIVERDGRNPSTGLFV